MSSRAKDSAVLGLLLVLMAAGQFISYRFNGSLSKMDLLLATTCLGGLVFSVCRSPGRGGDSVSPARIFLILGLAVWLHASLGLGSWLLLALIPAFVIARYVPEAGWAVFRRAVLVGCLLWSATPVVHALVAAPQVRWLGAAARGAPEVTVVLLLDEFSAKAAGPVEAALVATGVTYRRKALAPFGPDTINVLPALFTGMNFERGSVCWTSSICSGARVFDFARVSAGRQDMDVVGAAMPYCAMRGLRYCEAIPFVSNIFDASSWRCAASRRWTMLKSFFKDGQGPRCIDDLVGEVESRVEAAIWRAPVWKDGGFLFAHLMLPHPPGKESARGSLAADYAGNVDHAARLVEAVARRLQMMQRHFRLVIFSDHPLRRRHCDGVVYDRADCQHADLFDDRVPLFVAGDVPPAFEDIQNNVDIFRLASQ